MFTLRKQALLSVAVSICAVWILGCSDDSLNGAFSKKFAPDAPRGVYASYSNGINVRWDYVDEATGYIVYRSESGSGKYDKVGTTQSASYTDSYSSLSSGTTYYYKVSAYNHAGEGSKSSSSNGVATVPYAPSDVSASVATLERPGVPSSVSATASSTGSINVSWNPATSTGSITVTWNAVSGAAGYYVYRSTSSSGTYSQVGNTSSTSYTNTGLSSGTTYYYKVAAYNNAGTSSQSYYSNPATISGATGYYVYRSESAAGPYSQVGVVSSTSYTNTGLPAGKTYYYKVSAYNSAGEGAQSSYSGATTGFSAPTSVSATATSPSSITVNWSSVSGATGYKVYRSTSSSGTYSLVDNVSSTTYTNDYLSSGTTYYYRVSAYNDVTESSQSSYAYATTALGAPSSVSARATSASSIDISWSSVNGADGYRVYRSSSAEGIYTLLGTTYSTTYTNTGLSSNTAYYYKVSAYNSSGESAMSSYNYATTNMSIPNAPSGVAATANANSITISWNLVSGASDYLVYSASSEYGSYNLAGTSSSASYTHTGLSSGTTYYYKVYSRNAAGESSSSLVVEATTVPNAPTGVTVTVVTSTSVTLTWTPVSGALGYRVYRGASSSGSYTLVGTTSSPTYTNAGLSQATTYYYEVSAYNDGGESSRSQYRSALTMFTDSRSGKTYKTIRIGTKTWMAANLYYQADFGNYWCYEYEDSNCDLYGMLYDWETAAEVCPTGWHLATRQEWSNLVTVAGGDDAAGKKLRSASDWEAGGVVGTDDYGFAALPGGSRNPGGFNNDLGYYGGWWTGTADNNSGTAYYRFMQYDESAIVETSDVTSIGLSVRCVQD